MQLTSLLRNSAFLRRVHMILPYDLNMSNVNPSHVVAPNLISIHFNIIILPTPTTSKLSSLPIKLLYTSH
jgi:hypothetical protein